MMDAARRAEERKHAEDAAPDGFIAGEAHPLEATDRNGEESRLTNEELNEMEMEIIGGHPPRDLSSADPPREGPRRTIEPDSKQNLDPSKTQHHPRSDDENKIRRGRTDQQEMSTASVGGAPIWPVLAAPFVAGIYYVALRWGFERSIEPAFGTFTVNSLGDVTDPIWGSHWAYRIVAELISVSFGTFIAAGLARGRERTAGIIGGCSISLVFLIGTAGVLYIRLFMYPENWKFTEPWYQYVIDVGMVIGCPISGVQAADAAREINSDTPTGFAGINRFHFLWLWFIAFLYALGLITPLTGHFVSMSINSSLFAIVGDIMVDGIPAAALLIPGYFGLALLCGRKGTSLRPLLRNLFAIIVLVVGLLVGVAFTALWLYIVKWLSG